MPAPKLLCKEIKQIFHEVFPGRPHFTPEKYPDLTGKVTIVTGGNTGVGYHTAKLLAGASNAKVYIFSRNQEKTKVAIEKMQEEIAKEFSKSDPFIEQIKIDLSDLESIKIAAQEFLEKENRLDIIIHNAGVMTPPYGSKTKQGYELQLGTNTIGPFLLQKLLDDLFIKTSFTNPKNLSRIVWVSSSAHFNAIENGGINWGDINYEDESKNYPPFEIYGQSKSGTVILSIQWCKHHPEAENVVSISICPGLLKTELQRYMPWYQRLATNLLFHPARHGAYTELYAALSPDVTMNENGLFIIPWGKIGIIRSDVEKGAHGENGSKFWNYLEEQVAEYSV